MDVSKPDRAPFAYLDPSRGPGKPPSPYTPRLRRPRGITVGLMSNLVDASAFLVAALRDGLTSDCSQVA